jgi:hypothetical protein
MNPLYRNILIIYFITHIPATLIIDMQLLFGKYYPEFLRKFLLENYILKFGDFLMGGDVLVGSTPLFFKGLIGFEIIQIPFFFIAIYALIFKKNWIRIPAIIYSSHVVTAVSLILLEFYYSILLDNQQRVILFSFYLPYLLLPLSLLFYMSFVVTPFVNKDNKKKSK